VLTLVAGVGDEVVDELLDLELAKCVRGRASQGYRELQPRSDVRQQREGFV
jgi:hypothetical protein